VGGGVGAGMRTMLRAPYSAGCFGLRSG
jgi:hypothetical protein